MLRAGRRRMVSRCPDGKEIQERNTAPEVSVPTCILKEEKEGATERRAQIARAEIRFHFTEPPILLL